MRKKLGFIVNPIAGMGGRVGLKGSDGSEILKKALELGAVPESPVRASQALTRMKSIRDDIEIITYPYHMGQYEAANLGFTARVIGKTAENETTAADTEEAVKAMLEMGVDIILFAGGDGTARNIHDVVGMKVPVLGIPTGVKIHSGVYATSPANAGDLVYKFLNKSQKVVLKEAEVMDIDEEAFREDRVSARLYGYMKVPYERTLLQSAKAGSSAGEAVSMDSIASEVINGMEEDWLYIMGPGTTSRAVMDKLSLKNTLLGVDVVCNKTLLASDVNEQELLTLLEGKKAKIVVTIIGGQGYIFGRGNQQISHRVIRRVGIENVVVISTESKILALEGNPLMVDTGDQEMNKELSGYVKVVTGLGKYMAYRVTY